MSCDTSVLFERYDRERYVAAILAFWAPAQTGRDGGDVDARVNDAPATRGPERDPSAADGMVVEGADGIAQGDEAGGRFSPDAGESPAPIGTAIAEPQEATTDLYGEATDVAAGWPESVPRAGDFDLVPPLEEITFDSLADDGEVDESWRPPGGGEGELPRVTDAGHPEDKDDDEEPDGEAAGTLARSDDSGAMGSNEPLADPSPIEAPWAREPEPDRFAPMEVLSLHDARYDDPSEIDAGSVADPTDEDAVPSAVTHDEGTGADAASPTPDATDPFLGLDWRVLALIADQPAPMIPIIIKLACAIRGTGSLRIATAQAVTLLKRTNTQIVTAAGRLHALFKVSKDGSTITLLNAPLGPNDLTREERHRMEIERRRAERKAETERQQRLRDDEKTPSNDLRIILEETGMTRDDARTFAWHLIRTYTFDPSMRAARTAKDKRPGEPKGYIIGILKNAMRNATNSGEAGIARSKIKPTGSRRTEVVGWEDRLVNGVRNRLVRLPDGRLKREPPAFGVTPPSLEEDFGVKWVES